MDDETKAAIEELRGHVVRLQGDVGNLREMLLSQGNQINGLGAKAAIAKAGTTESERKP